MRWSLNDVIMRGVIKSIWSGSRSSCWLVYMNVCKWFELFRRFIVDIVLGGR